jgi:disulfide bond formation protein DsbB
LQPLEQTRHAFILPWAPVTTSHPSRLVTLGGVNDEQFQLFFALLALLALAGSVALVVARLASGAARPLLDGLAPLRLPVPALVTSVAMLGSLWFSEVVGYRPCVLCWYQRIAMYSLAIVLVVASVRRDRNIVSYAMVLAGVGAAVSGYHWLLERWPSIDTGSCSPDAPCSVPYFEVFGFVSLAFMALCAFVTVLVFLGVLSGPGAARMEQPAAAAVTTQTKEPA